MIARLPPATRERAPRALAGELGIDASTLAAKVEALCTQGFESNRRAWT